MAATGADKCIATLKKFWPNLNITKQNLLHPTQENLIEVYKTFFEDIEKSLLNILDFYEDGIHTKDIVNSTFLKIQVFAKIFNNISFTANDFYEPTPSIVKMFFKLCVHILTYYDTEVYPFLKSEVGELMKLREGIAKLHEESIEILEKINEKSIQKVELEETLNALKAEVQLLAVKKENCLIKQCEDDKKIKEKECELEKLKFHSKQLEDELLRLREEKQQLKDNIVDEEEYLCLQQNVKDGQNTYKSLTEQYNNLTQQIETHKKDVALLDELNVSMPAHFNNNLVETHEGLKTELKQLEAEIMQNTHQVVSQKLSYSLIKKSLEDMIIKTTEASSTAKDVESHIKKRSETLLQEVKNHKSQIQSLLAEQQILKLDNEQIESNLESRKQYVLTTVSALNEQEILKNVTDYLFNK